MYVLSNSWPLRSASIHAFLTQIPMSNSESAVYADVEEGIDADVEIDEGDADVEVVGSLCWAESISFRLRHFLMAISTDNSISMYH